MSEWAGAWQRKPGPSSQSTLVCVCVCGGGELRNKGMRAEVLFLLWGLGVVSGHSTFSSSVGRRHFPPWNVPLYLPRASRHRPPAFGLN